MRSEVTVDVESRSQLSYILRYCPALDMRTVASRRPDSSGRFLDASRANHTRVYYAAMISWR